MWGEGDERCFHPMNQLNLYTIMTAKMFYVFREPLPVFEKLSQLFVNLSNFCWSALPVLIKKSPNLKTLHQQEIVCECVSEYSFLSSCPLEVLKITEYYDSFEELIQMKHFLEKLSCLELVEVHSQARGKRKLRLISRSAKATQSRVVPRFA